MVDEKIILQQLQVLKGMTVTTGVIHEAQTLQLQMWPLVAFPFALSTVAKIDTESRTVTFEIVTSLKKDPTGKANDRAKEYVQEWTRKILWDNTKVNYHWINNGKRTRKSTT